MARLYQRGVKSPASPKSVAYKRGITPPQARAADEFEASATDQGPASVMLRVRLTPSEAMRLKSIAERAGTNMSGLVRDSALKHGDVMDGIAMITDEVEHRALSELEAHLLEKLSVAAYVAAGGPDVRLEPTKRRPSKASPISERGVLDLAALQGYLVMPSDRGSAAVLGHLIVGLVRTGRLERWATNDHGTSKLSDEDLMAGRPDAVIGVRPRRR